MPISHQKVPSRQAFARPAIDWTGVWAGTVAIALAAFVWIADGNPVAAAFVLIAVAAIIAVMLYEGAQSQPD